MYYFLSVYPEKSTISFPIRTGVLFLFRDHRKSAISFPNEYMPPIQTARRSTISFPIRIEVLFLFCNHWKSAISFPHERMLPF